MIGDLLLSQGASHGVNESLPMIPRRVRPDVGLELSHETHAPFGLCQKLVLLNDRVAIGWAGEYWTARRVVRRLRSQLAGAYERAQIDAAMRSVADECWGKVDILGMALLREGVLTFEVGAGATRFPTSRFQDLTLIGTGTDAFIAMRDEGQLMDMSNEPSAFDQFADLFGIIPSLMSSELVSLETLKRKFGGGYELVYRSGRHQFTKPSDVLFCVHEAWANGDEVRDRLLVLYRYSYFNDHLLIRALDWGDDILSDELHVATPVDYDGTREYFNTVPRPQYECDLIVQIVLVKTGVNEITAVSQVIDQPEEDTVKVRVEGDTVAVHIGDYLMNPLRSRVKVALRL